MWIVVMIRMISKTCPTHNIVERLIALRPKNPRPRASFDYSSGENLSNQTTLAVECDSLRPRRLRLGRYLFNTRVPHNCPSNAKTEGKWE